jgi:deoxyribodipyrimidine photo-lyase
MEGRVRALNSEPVRPGGRYVLYRADRNRRVRENHALAFAAAMANGLDRPLLVYESLPYSYPCACDRFHTFVLEGAPEMARRVRELGAGYVFDLRRTPADPGDGFAELAAEAAAVVLDDYPGPLEDPNLGLAAYAVDSSCIVPMSAIPDRQYAAYAIRPKIRTLLARHLRPVELPRLGREFRHPPEQFHTEVTEAAIPHLVASCLIDHTVRPVPPARGGAQAAEAALERFLETNLRRYARLRNDPVAHATSGLSPYLHFGQISSLEVALRARAYAERRKLIADDFLEQLIVRRELAFNFAWYAGRRDSLDELPEWARRTLAEHARDPRPVVYTMEEFAAARTADPLWNAAQKEMLLRGVIHPYCRMYWGKKIIEWSARPEDALMAATRIHDRFALDGADPNTAANILWCFGLHDRPWPARPIFGTVRTMTLGGMERKVDVGAYIREIEDAWRSR